MNTECQPPDAILLLADGFDEASFAVCLAAKILHDKTKHTLSYAYYEDLEEVLLCPWEFWEEERAVREESHKDAQERLRLVETEALSGSWTPPNVQVVQKRNTQIQQLRRLKQRVDEAVSNWPAATNALWETLRSNVAYDVSSRIDPVATQNLRRPPEPDTVQPASRTERLAASACCRQAMQDVAECVQRLNEWLELEGFFAELREVSDGIAVLPEDIKPSLELDEEDLQPTDPVAGEAAV